MPVVQVWKTDDGTIFTDRNQAIAHDAMLVRRTKVFNLLRQHRPFLTDTGRPRDDIPFQDVVNYIVSNFVQLRNILV